MRNAADQFQRALVVFGDTEIKLLWFLKKGFRHCFAIIEGQGGWAIYNPLSHYTEIKLYSSLPENEIVDFYTAHGYCVVKTHVNEPEKKIAPFALYTCVEAVKRALGLQARWIATPWQLYRYLKIHSKEEKELTNAI